MKNKTKQCPFCGKELKLVSSTKPKIFYCNECDYHFMLVGKKLENMTRGNRNIIKSIGETFKQIKENKENI